ncbi:Glycosyl hydrolase family protein [Kiritimatiella glycovorans]|uniref:Glycosyl hydrolase family protein n=1 Tax=Kiritimatiella glycovorans TaxID=1307763 RepID=A0A0G3EDR0_9BACT|nr:Glycosyl hydrolase family protein [Kiritimatiella glycovorans]
MRAAIPGCVILLAAALCPTRGTAAGSAVEITREAEALAEHILKVRGAPLRNIEGLERIDARDFGAVPDDGREDGEAIRRAMQAINRKGGGVELVFEPGRYMVDPGAGLSNAAVAGLMLRSVEDVVIDGRGAEMVIRRPECGFFRVRDSKRVIVRDFTIDYDPLPFTQGTVTDLDRRAGWIDVRVDPGFPAPADPFFESFNSWGMIKDPAHPGKLKDGVPNFMMRDSCEDRGDGVFRIRLKERSGSRGWETIETGDRYAQVGRASGGCRFDDSERITFERITYYACPGSLFVGTTTSRLNVLDCRSRLRDGRILTSGADGVHCQAARVGPWIEGCEFEGLSDDCLNVYSTPLYVLDRLDDRRLRMTRPERIRAGDRLAFFRPQTGRVLHGGRVESVRDGIVTFSAAVPDLELAPEGTPFDRHDWKIYDHAYNRDATGNYFVYRDNYMHDGRRYGGFIKASYGLIEDNRFERLSNHALCIENTPDWPEGFWARYLVVRGNRIIDCAFLEREPMVSVDWLTLGARSSGIPMQTDLFFINNEMRGRFNPPARFRCTKRLYLEGNRPECER